MRALSMTILASFVALTLAAAPASAHSFMHGGGGHGFWGGGAGVGLGLGLAAGVIGAGVAADAYCVRYVPTYDAWGNYVGQRPVNAC